MEIKVVTVERTNPAGGVITVHWRTVETSGEFSASQYGTESFTPNPDAPGYIPYEQLTEADVVGWLNERWGAEGLAAKQAALDADLANQANPPVVSGLPWVNA